MRFQRTRIPAPTIVGIAAALLVAGGLTLAHAQGVPGSTPNKCLAGKTKCVNKKVAGLLKCREKCQKNPGKCGSVQTDCEAKVMAKFDGGTKGFDKSCFGKLEAKDDGVTPEKICTTTGGPGSPPPEVDGFETKVDAFVAEVVGALENGRFEDTGLTVIDHQTGLEWEKKVAGSGCLHCVDDIYDWTTDFNSMFDWVSEVNGVSADGSTQTGLGGHSDWRIPSVAEWQTVLPLDPVFGPAGAFAYWSSTTLSSNPNGAWAVDFFGNPGISNKSIDTHVRAVRGGS